MLGRGDRIARAVEFGMGLLGLLAQGFGRELGAFGAARFPLARGFGRGGVLFGLGGFALERGKALPFDEPRSGGAVSAGLEAVTVPAPKIAFLRHEPLAWCELGLELVAARSLDHADLP